MALFTFIASARTYDSVPNPDEVNITRIAEDLDDMTVGMVVGIVGSDDVFRYSTIVDLDDSAAPSCVVTITAPSGVTGGNLNTTMPLANQYYVYAVGTEIPAGYSPEAENQSNSNIDRMFYSPVNQNLIRASSKSATILQRWVDFDEELDGNDGQWITLDDDRRYCDHVPSRNFDYVLSSDHLRRVNSDNTSTEIGWVPEGLSIFPGTVGTGSDPIGIITTSKAVAYKFVIGIKSVEDEAFLGADSGRAVLFTPTLGGPNFTPRLYCMFAAGSSTSNFIQVYRTDIVANTEDPGDIFYLVYERFLTSGEITNGYAVFEDTVPVGGGGPFLYTNQDEETAGKSNYPCECICGENGEGGIELYNDSIYAWNFTPRSNLDLSFLKPWFDISVATGLSLSGATTNGSPNITSVLIDADAWEFIQPGMAVIELVPSGTITDLVLAINTRVVVSSNPGTTTIVTSDNFTITDASAQFALMPYLNFTNNDDVDFNIYFLDPAAVSEAAMSVTVPDDFIGTNIVPLVKEEEFYPSTPAQFIDIVANRFVSIFNAYSGNTVLNARYMSTADGLPGQILIYAESDRESEFFVQSFGFDENNWYPNITSQVNIISKPEPSIIQFSKPNEPMAFAPGDEIRVPHNAQVLDCKTIMGVMAIETSRGYYRCTGTYFDPKAVDELNLSLQPLYTSDNPGYGMVVVDNFGFGMTTRGLCRITETNVEVVPNNPKQLIGIQLTGTIRRLSADDSKGLVRVPTANGTWTYDVRQNKWYSDTDVVRCGAFDTLQVKPAVHIGSITERQRDAQESAESFYDASFSDVELDTVSQYTVTLADAVPSGIEVGDVIEQDDLSATITAINGLALTVDELGFDADETVTLYAGYNAKVTYCPMGPGVGASKTWVNGSLIFDTPDVGPTSVEDLNVSDHGRYVKTGFKTDLRDTAVFNNGQVTEPVGSAFRFNFDFPRETKFSDNITPSWIVRVCRNTFKILGMNLNFSAEDSADSRNRGKS